MLQVRAEQSELSAQVRLAACGEILAAAERPVDGEGAPAEQRRHCFRIVLCFVFPIGPVQLCVRVRARASTVRLGCERASELAESGKSRIRPYLFAVGRGRRTGKQASVRSARATAKLLAMNPH